MHTHHLGARRRGPARRGPAPHSPPENSPTRLLDLLLGNPVARPCAPPPRLLAPHSPSLPARWRPAPGSRSFPPRAHPHTHLPELAGPLATSAVHPLAAALSCTLGARRRRALRCEQGSGARPRHPCRDGARGALLRVARRRPRSRAARRELRDHPAGHHGVARRRRPAADGRLAVAERHDRRPHGVAALGGVLGGGPWEAASSPAGLAAALRSKRRGSIGGRAGALLSQLLLTAPPQRTAPASTPSPPCCLPGTHWAEDHHLHQGLASSSSCPSARPHLPTSLRTLVPLATLPLRGWWASASAPGWAS